MGTSNKPSWVDTHAHIYLEDFDKDRSEVVSKAIDDGCQNIYMPNIDHTSIDRMLDTELKFKECIPMMGLHPCSVKKGFEKELYTVEQWLSKRTFAAVGEIGTDLYWDKTFWEEQKEAFTIQVNWAKEKKIPVVIHCRESLDQTIDLIETLNDETLTGIFHCFSGSLDQAKKIIELGFYIGIGGVSTFKNGGLDTVLPEVNLRNIVLETDSPYLAPVPHRGKRNEPAFTSLIADRIANLKEKTVVEVLNETTFNAMKIFKLEHES